jgi:hypothetical protein
MQEVVTHWTGDEARLLVTGTVAPEFVEAGWTHCAPTIFYPDRSRWGADRLKEGEADELPMPISRDAEQGQWAPVVARFYTIFQQVVMRGVSNELRTGR